ncbi:hypothetical protein STEG23_017159 [Scotinomys teguina]
MQIIDDLYAHGNYRPVAKHLDYSSVNGNRKTQPSIATRSLRSSPQGTSFRLRGGPESEEEEGNEDNERRAAEDAEEEGEADQQDGPCCRSSLSSSRWGAGGGAGGGGYGRAPATWDRVRVDGGSGGGGGCRDGDDGRRDSELRGAAARTSAFECSTYPYPALTGQCSFIYQPVRATHIYSIQKDIPQQTFDETIRKPISLGCGHTVCKMCLNKLHRKACPFDQTTINTDIELLPVNSALLQLVGAQIPEQQPITLCSGVEDTKHYEEAKKCVEELALYLKPLSSARGVGLNSTTQSVLSRPMQRKLVTLVHCQLVEEEGRIRAMRAARSLGERTVTELILQHQNPQQLSSNLWAAVRARGCQFLGPAMQEEALKLVLLALEDGSALSRKVLVLFVVQRLEPRFPQASKTSIGHVVQLLYRASCFKVTKRDEDSSLMQLKEEFRTYEALRREHDSQIVQIAMEAGLRIAPDQWSSLLYGDQSHKSHMQSIIDKVYEELEDNLSI